MEDRINRVASNRETKHSDELSIASQVSDELSEVGARSAGSADRAQETHNQVEDPDDLSRPLEESSDGSDSPFGNGLSSLPDSESRTVSGDLSARSTSDGAPGSQTEANRGGERGAGASAMGRAGIGTDPVLPVNGESMGAGVAGVPQAGGVDGSADTRTPLDPGALARSGGNGSGRFEVHEMIPIREPSPDEVSKERSAAAAARGAERTSSLASLLDRFSKTSEARGAASVDPAVARAEQVQQAIALEQAARSFAGGRPVGPQSGVSILQGDARQGVLADVTTRESATLDSGTRNGKIATRALGVLASQRGGTITMRLDPPSLGELAVRMTVVDGSVRADLNATTDTARAILEQNIEMLRASLEARGLKVDRLHVGGPGSSAEPGGMRSESQQQTQSGGSGALNDDGADDGERDAAGRESRGRGGERRGGSGRETGTSERSFREAFEQD